MEEKIKRILKDDRRTQKTKKLLSDSLKDLILEKGYDAITVQDIIDKANVGRSTFYNHYESKDELLVGNINFQQALVQIPLGDDENYAMGVNISYLFGHTKEYLHVARAMINSKGMDVLTNYFAELCVSRFFEYNKALGGQINTEMLRYKAEMAAGGVVRMLFKWLEDGAAVSVDEMVVYARKMIESCFANNN